MKQEDIYCFGCSPHNPIGLKLEFEYSDDSAKTTWKPTKDYEGFPGLLHGGIISTILDETMAKAIEHSNIYAVTIEMNVKYLKKTPIDDTLTAQAMLVKKRKKILYLESQLLDSSGNITAEATAKFFVLDNIKPSDIEK